MTLPAPAISPAGDDAQLIGVDLGGSAIKLVRCDRHGQILASSECPTPDPAVPGAVATAIVAAIEALDPEHRAAWVGIGHPGPSDRNGREARLAINLPLWREVPLADWLEPQLGRRVTTANDADCALLGECWRGAARGRQHVLLLTLGTGVGGGVLIAGRLFLGHGGISPEPGLIGLDPHGPPCRSGNRGSLEQHCSIEALTRLAGVDPGELCRRADGGDPQALEHWRTYGRRLGTGLSSLLYVLNPELVLLGGGLSGASVHFLPALRQEVEQRVLAVNREGLEIHRCALGNGAGRLGAAWLAGERLAGITLE